MNTALKKILIQKSENVFEKVQSIRRHLHQYPELSFQEYNTSKFISSLLSEWNIPQKKLANTGIVSYLGNPSSKKCIAIRADIDALPIHEKNICDYSSKVNGVMHACGHDVHTASALGSILVLKDLQSELNGCVKILFQPGEELLPGGATLMIKKKALEKPKVHSIIAQHVFPDLEAGKLGFRSGPYMASTDEVYIYIKGKGGHGAMPQRANNPIPVASHLLSKISNDFTLNKMLEENFVVSFGKIIANGATNVIPETVEIAGTIRTLNDQKRKSIHQYLEKTTQQFSKKYKIKIELKIIKGYPPLINDTAHTNFFKEKAIELLGKKNVIDLPIRMTADDFAYYLQKIPGTYYRLGTGNKRKGITHNVHTPYFDIDENALYYGTLSLSWFAINYLQNFQK
jgi:amidohydrolase